MSQTEIPVNGYICTPYMHNHESIELKEDLLDSKNIDCLYFVTATFSADSRPYFTSPFNHYLLAKFKNNQKILKEIKKYKQEPMSFIFSMDENLFERESNNGISFVSVYYLEYKETDDINEIASVVAKREKVGKAGIGHMNIHSITPQKFTFPYMNNIVIFEVSSKKSHQSVNKYCEKTRRDVSRRGITMTNLLSLSILEQLK